MSILKKLLRIPSGEIVTVEAHDTWEVRWWSMGRIGPDGHGRSTGRVEVFPSKEDAERFAKELTAAAALLQDTDGYNYTSRTNLKWGPYVSKNKYKGVTP